MKTSKKLTDEELIELVRSKDQERYSEIVERYQSKLLRFANFLTRDSDMAEDVVQNSFIKAYRNLHSFKIKKQFSSWIYRIVHNEAINQIKRQKKQISLDNNKFLLETLRADEDIELDFEKKETREILVKCLESLPLKYREPLVLFFLEEKSYSEISDILRLPTSTVGTRIKRGKIYLKRMCEKKGELNYER